MVLGEIKVRTRAQWSDPFKSRGTHSMQEVLWSILFGMGEERLRAAKEIQRLTQTSAKTRAFLAAAGVIVPLVSMLKSSSTDAKEAAVLALLNLAARNERNKISIVTAGVLEPLMELLQSQDAKFMEPAAAALLTLSAANANKQVIGASGSIPLLAEMISSGSLQGKVDAVLALYNLSTFPGNVVRMLAAGAVSPLLCLLRDCKKSSKVAEKIVAILESMMSFEEGRLGAFKEEGGLLAMVEVLEEGSSHGREHAVGALLILCESNRSKYKDALLQEGVIPGLLELTVQGTPQAQRKARQLLEMLRDVRRPRRVVSASGSPAAVIESIVYEIAKHVDSSGPSGRGAAKEMLTEMLQLSMDHETRTFSTSS